MASDPTTDTAAGAAPLDPPTEGQIPLNLSAADIIGSITDAFVTLDGEWRFVSLNDQAERMLARPRAELLGRSIWEAFPDAVGTVSDREYRRAVDERVAVSFEQFYPPLDAWFEVRAYLYEGGLSVFFQTVTERRRAEEALRRSQEDLRFAIDGARLGTFYCDFPLDRIVWNDTCKEHFFLPPDAEVDFSLFYSLLHPDDREPTRQAIERAMADRVDYDVEYRTLAPDGRTRWVNAVGRFYYDAERRPTRFDGITLDITERRQAERRLRQLFDSQVVGVIFWNLDTGLITDANDTFLSLVGYTRADLAAGQLDFRRMTPPEWEERNEQGVAAIRAAGSAPTYEKEYFRKDGSRVPILIGGTRFEESGAEGFSYILDITERKYLEIEQERLLGEALARAEREALLNQIGQAIRTTLDPEEIQQVAVRALGETLRADRCYFSLFDLGADLNWVGQDFRRGDLPSLAGRYRLSDFQVNPEDYYPGGRTFVVSDALDAVWSFPEALLAAIRQLRVRSAVGVPLFSEGRLVATLSVAMADEPRAWTDDEVRLVEAVASQTRSAVEAARLLAERQAHLQVEALLGRIGAALRSTLDPDLIQETAATLLGEALSADRCFYVAYDLARDRAQVSQDWRREDLPSLAGGYSASDFGPLLTELFPAPQTAVVGDVRAAFSPAVASVFEASRHRAVLVVPFFDAGTLVAALYISQTDTPRAWTAEEVALAEQVATLTRAALEAARVQRREHAVAERLAQALQPQAPARVPGLELAEYYRAAWEDQGVGGDFSDVFQADKGVTFLVVGDLSGKGLDAASQVATVRQMLRFALLNGRTVAGPVGALNRTLAEHGLLTGFATLFAGRYDADSRTLTYVNCGQDAGLVLRAAGEIKTLPPTGPVLGAFGDATYTEEAVRLYQGDVLTLYTDGLTEAGPSRMALLTGDGVADLLRGLVGVTAPQEIVSRLMAGVDAHAGRGVRDDQCLLVGVISEYRASAANTATVSAK